MARALQIGEPPARDAVSLPRPSLRSNFAWNLVGNVVFAASQWGLLIVLAKLTAPEQLGQFVLALSVTGPIFVFSQLHLRGILATDASGRFSFDQYLKLRNWTTLAALAVSVGLAIYYSAAAWTILAIAVSRVFDGLGDIYQGFAQQAEVADRIGISQIMRGAGSLVLLLGGLAAFHGVTGAAAGVACASAAVFLFYDRFNVKPENAPKPARTGSLRDLAVLALPLALVMTMISLQLNIPRYFVHRAGGESELGVFAAITYFAAAVNVVVAAAGNTLMPRWAKQFAAGSRGPFYWLVWRSIAAAAGSGLVATLGAWLLGTALLTAFYRPEYAEHNGILVGTMAVSTLLAAAQLLGYAMTAAGEFKRQVPLFAAVGAVTLGSSALLVPRFGMMGAVVAGGLAAMVQIAGSGWLLDRAWRRR